MRLALVAAVLALLTGCTGTSDPEAPPRADQSATVQQQLDRLADGLRQGDIDRVRSLAPSATARERLQDIAENARALKLRSVTWQYLRSVTNPDQSGQWTAEVSLGWRISGFDTAPTYVSVVSRFQRADDGGVTIVNPAEAGQRPLWLAPGLKTSRGSGILVMTEAARIDAADLHFRSVAAARTVRRALPEWDGRAVIEVPADTQALDHALGREPGESAGVAAVAAPAGQGTSAHVFVNPDLIGPLDALGAQIVLRHELVHVATHSATSAAPLWLVEGFADQVALRGVPRSRAVLAGDLINQVQERGPLRRLPRSEEFAATGADLAAAYQAAWLACDLIAERVGARGLSATYHAASRGQPIDAVLRRHADISLAELTRAWQQRQQTLSEER